MLASGRCLVGRCRLPMRLRRPMCTAGSLLRWLLDAQPLFADMGVPAEAVAEAYDAWERGEVSSPLTAAAISNQVGGAVACLIVCLLLMSLMDVSGGKGERLEIPNAAALVGSLPIIGAEWVGVVQHQTQPVSKPHELGGGGSSLFAVLDVLLAGS